MSFKGGADRELSQFVLSCAEKIGWAYLRSTSIKLDQDEALPAGSQKKALQTRIKPQDPP